ncbi:MAG: hypothetical protein K6B52_03570, partial [Clostridiales bacterium]|nr:hypothetical protein [Clostridiales bacterium]
MKKIVSVIVAVLLCFSLSSCGENGESNSNNKKGKQSVASQSVSLAYSKGDSLSPFECETQVNYQLSRLVYDGLYTLNGQYEPVSAIAQSGIISGNSVNVTLSQAYFSNGDLVTANDISFSFEKARVSPAYSESLKNFASVSVSSPSMLVFTLISPDPYALS